MNIASQPKRKTMKKHSIVALALVSFALVLATVTIAGDPFFGTWKLNLAKSKFPPGQQLKSATTKREARDKGFKSTWDVVDAEGKASHIVYDVKFDGKDYTRIDANTYGYVEKKDGKEVRRGRIVVSKDGKTTTETLKMKDAKGQEFTIILVSDKVNDKQ
jgi:hypothetical protein